MSERQVPASSRWDFRRVGILVCKLGVVVVALGYLVYGGKLRWEYLVFPVGRTGYLALGLGLLLAVSALVVARYAVLLPAVGIRLRWTRVFSTVLVGAFFNLFMFGGVGGDAIKVAYVMRDSGKKAAAVASVVADRALGLLSFLTVGAVALMASYSKVAAYPQMHALAVTNTAVLVTASSCMLVSIVVLTKDRKWGGICWGLLAAGMLAAGALLTSGRPLLLQGEDLGAVLGTRMALALLLGLLPALACLWVVPACSPGNRFSELVRNRLPLGAKVMNLAEALLKFRGRLGSLLLALVLSLVMQGLTILSLYAFSRLLDLDSPPDVQHVFFSAPLSFIANMLPVPGGGLGVGENAFEWLLGLCRSESGEAITGGAAIFLTWRFWAAVVGLAGLPFYLISKRERVRSVAAPGDQEAR